MSLAKRIKEMRMAQGLTQEQMAECLNVTAQTVSKWERELVSPDVQMLPRIAVLLKTSSDELLGMSDYWGEDRHQSFLTRVRMLKSRNEVMDAYFDEINVRPTQYRLYTDLALYMVRWKISEPTYVERLLKLGERLDRLCSDDDIRNEMHRRLIMICAYAGDGFREKAMEYYLKIPSIRDSREIYASLVLKGDERISRIKENVVYMIDLVECAVHQLITEELSAEEKLVYYQKAAGLYQWLLDGEYGGFYEYPLLYDLVKIAELLYELGRDSEAEKEMTAFLQYARRMLESIGLGKQSMFVINPEPEGYTPCYVNMKHLLRTMLSKKCFSKWRESIADLHADYEALCRAGK